MDSSKCCVVLTTTGSKENADIIVKALLESKLAACVQIDEVESFFATRRAIGKRMNFV